MTTARSGTAEVTFNDADLNRSLKPLPGKAADSFALRSTATLVGVESNAMARWPVRTGRTRDSFGVSVARHGLTVVTTLTNAADYAKATRWGKESPSAGLSPWQELVREPVERSTKELNDELQYDLAKLAKDI